MSTYTLTLLDTVGIQGYIFGSNALRENIGASELVYRATRLWPFEEVRQAGKTNLKPKLLTGTPDDLDDRLHIEDDHLDAEIMYAGGGNCVIIFADMGVARHFVTRLSMRILAEAPDLNLVAVHLPVVWDQSDPVHSDILANKVQQALEQLAEKKRSRQHSTPLLGVSATVACRSTGLPAAGTDADEPGLKPDKERAHPLSAGILAKLAIVEEANRRLAGYLPHFRDVGLDIPYDLDNFGRAAGEISYIAVVHTDGNGMGNRIGKLRDDYQRPEDNRRYIQAMRDFSRAVEDGAKKALSDLSSRLLRHWIPEAKAIRGLADDGIGGLIPLDKPIVGLADREEKGKRHVYVPFRPVVFGGDDLTFVTDGRLGLALAAAHLTSFGTAMNAQPNPYAKGLQASAGVAVVKTHYPFSRAYDLADDLCQNAKQTYQRVYPALDWHFVATGLFGDIAAIRKRQYAVPAGHLEMRPVPLEKQIESWRSWPGFASATKAFLIGKEWKGKHNKVIALRQALRRGPDAVEQFRHAYGLPELPLLTEGIAALQTSGWDGAERCGYFDSVEALDFFTPLDG